MRQLTSGSLIALMELFKSGASIAIRLDCGKLHFDSAICYAEVQVRTP